MISVCVATYNGEKYIENQLHSILPQLSEDDEIIISDDGSVDSTISIIESFNDRRIRLEENKTKHGINSNFENAIKHAKGDYIFLSDQDDVWMSDKLKRCLPYLEKYDCILHDGYVTDGQLNIMKNSIIGNQHLGGFISNLCHNKFTGCCMAFKASVKDIIIPIPKSKYFLHDQWIGLLCLLKLKTYFIPDKLIYFRRHQENSSSATGRSERSLLKRVYSRVLLLSYLLFR